MYANQPKPNLSIFSPALIHIILILALRAAKDIVGTAGDKCFLAVLTEPQRMLVVHQHKAEHQLDRHEQRMEVPDNRGTGGRLIK